MKHLTMNQTREALNLLSVMDMLHVEYMAAGTISENAAHIRNKAQGGRVIRCIYVSSRARKANLDAIAAAVAAAIGMDRWTEIVNVVTAQYPQEAQEAQEAPTTAPAADTTETTTETAEAAQAAPVARQDDTAAAILGAIGATAPAHTVTVTWTNGTRATYSAAMLDMIRTDPAAIDIQDDDTGELVYIRP